MKNTLFCFVALLFIYACKTAETITPITPVVTPNRPPSDFSVTQKLKADGKTIVLNWTKAKDPDGDAVTYAVVLKDTLTKSISDTTYTIEGLDFNYTQAAKIIAKDTKGLKTEASFTATTKAIVYISIPDPIFEKALIDLKIDKDGFVNGKMDAEDAKGVKDLDVSSKAIKSLVGIEHFIELERLNFKANQLTVIDISKNKVLRALVCDSNQLITLDVTNNTELWFLHCASNKLTELNVYKNTALTDLNCSTNNIKVLNVSKNTNLSFLNCDTNQITTLDVSENKALTVLNCPSNQLTALDVSKNILLTDLNCASNKLIVLDISKNVAIVNLDCASNNITFLDLYKNISLFALVAKNNNLTTLDVSKNTGLGYLNCVLNQLTALDVSKNIALSILYCFNNQIMNICVANVTKAKANTNWMKDASATYSVCN
jgi:hypothetical protein